jgi:hypothetical protein
MEACLVCQHHESGHDSLATRVSMLSCESMVASHDPGALETYSRDDFIGILLEHETWQATVWVGREDEFRDIALDSIAISILQSEDHILVGTEMYGMTPSKLWDAGVAALLERMGVSGTCMICSFHCWGNLRAGRDADAMWQEGSAWLRIRYISRSFFWLAGDQDTTRGSSLEIGLDERFLEGWILYSLVSLVGVFRRLLVLRSYRTIPCRALQFTS